MADQIDTRPEYHTIIRCTPILEDAVRNDLTKLCGEISAVGLISPENASELRDPRGGTVTERAAKLVEFVANRVKVNSKDYVLFIQALTRRWVENKNILQELEKMYKKLGGKEETGVSAMLEACPPFAHTVPEPSMTSANQPPSHSDVHSTPANLCYSKNMTDDEFKRWLCCKGLTKEQDHHVLLDDGINAKCLACLKEADIEAVAGKLSIGGRAIFSDICKEAMKNVCVLVPKTSHDQKIFTTSASADSEPCASNSSENGNAPQLDQLLDMGRHHFKVSQSLKDLPNEDLITLGGALGLSFPKLKKMRDLPSEMVAAWLRKEDNVLERGLPTWRLLATALKDIGQNGVADSILQNVRT